MSNTLITALIDGGIKTLVALVLFFLDRYLNKRKRQRIKPASKKSQVGVVGGKEARNQVSPLPPEEN